MNKIVCPLRSAETNFGDLPAIIDGPETISFSQFDEAVTQLAQKLSEHGFERGDRVVLTLDSSVSQLKLILALIRIGSVAAPMSNRFPSSLINRAADRIEAKWMITDRRAVEAGRCELISAGQLMSAHNQTDKQPGAAGQLDLDQPATIILSSGSSAAPKAVLHTVGNHYYNALGANENLPFNSADRWLLSLPVYHVGGLAILFRSLLGGGAIVLPDRRLELPFAIERYHVTHISLVDTQLRRLLAAANLDSVRKSLKLILLGGGPIDPGLVRETFRAGLPLARTYGLTEMASQVTASLIGDDPTDTASAGKVLNHRVVQLSESGEIQVSGKTLFAGYVSGAALNRPVDQAGWFATGDRGHFDQAGNLIVMGRIDNMFISGGENIYPEEIEAALLAIDSLVEALVVPVDDSEFGKRPVAFVRFDSSVTIRPNEIAALLNKALPRFKIPDRFFPWPQGTEAAGLKPSRARLKKLAHDIITGGG